MDQEAYQVLLLVHVHDRCHAGLEHLHTPHPSSQTSAPSLAP